MKALDPIEMLTELIRIPSFSGEEEETADFLQRQMDVRGIPAQRTMNNVWAVNKYFDKAKPSILLNSHHDTVRPNAGYSRDPFTPAIEQGKLFGLGSNDAGGALVGLFHAFVHFHGEPNMKYNLIFSAVAEEETSSENGVIRLLKELPEVEFGIVGEPTEMNLAIAEKGLVVLDGLIKGVPGHAAHSNTVNPIYALAKDVEWLGNFAFEKQSEVTGPVRISVTQVQAGIQSNLVPAEARYVVDVRVPDVYSLEEVVDTLQKNTQATLEPRSLRLRPSAIDPNHPIVLSGLSEGRTTYGSPTLSDQAHMQFPTLKLGPGVSQRSHTADEFIEISELEEGVALYIRILKNVLL